MSYLDTSSTKSLLEHLERVERERDEAKDAHEYLLNEHRALLEETASLRNQVTAAELVLDMGSEHGPLAIAAKITKLVNVVEAARKWDHANQGHTSTKVDYEDENARHCELKATLAALEK